MVSDSDITNAVAETIGAARVADLVQALKLLCNQSVGSGRRRALVVNRMMDEFYRHFTTADQQRDALYRFQKDCLEPRVLLHVRVEYRVQACELSSTSPFVTPATGQATDAIPSVSPISPRSTVSMPLLSETTAFAAFSSRREAELALNSYGFDTDRTSIPEPAFKTFPNFQSMQKGSPSVLYSRIMHQRLPFYRSAEVVVAPMHLRSLMSAKKAEYLKGAVKLTQQVNNYGVASNTDLMIRFFKVDAGEPQLDVMPPNVAVEVAISRNDGKTQKSAILLEPTCVRFNQPKLKFIKPIIIPPEFAREPCLEITVCYTPSESPYEFAVSIFRAVPATIEDEIAVIRQTHIDAEVTKRSILKELKPVEENSADDDDVGAADVISLSLKCPISKARIKVPCRSKNCPVQHICDAYSFVEMNQLRPTWMCQMCKKLVFLPDLQYEPFMADLLISNSNDAVSFILNENGDDLSIKPPDNQQVARKEKSSVIATAFGGNSPRKNMAPSHAGLKRKRPAADGGANNVICISDDDEPSGGEAGSCDRKSLKRRRYATPIKYKPGSAGPGFGGVIILSDDDDDGGADGDVQVIEVRSTQRADAPVAPAPSVSSAVVPSAFDVAANVLCDAAVGMAAEVEPYIPAFFGLG